MPITLIDSRETPVISSFASLSTMEFFYNAHNHLCQKLGDISADLAAPPNCYNYSAGKSELITYNADVTVADVKLLHSAESTDGDGF